MMNFELDAKIDSYRSFFFLWNYCGDWCVFFFFFFFGKWLGGILGSGWKKGWFDGDVDRNALIPHVVNQDN